MESQELEVLAANQRFYDAFAERSFEKLEALWAREHDVAVIHPGWPPVFGREEVLDTWRQILEGPAPPNIRCSDARASVAGDTAYVICTEHLDGADLVATNLFVREDDAWRMLHHQAGPMPPPVPESPEMLH
jgi:ketosteroid isomerase-like protein